MLRIIRQKGVLTLTLTIVVLMVVTLTTLYTARVVQTDDKIFANAYRNAQALGAAHAGFDYALGFLNFSLLNQEAVLGAVSGTVPTTTPAGVLSGNLARCTSGSATTPITLTSPSALANGATFTMTYSCLATNNITTLNIKSVGASNDGSANRTVQATVYRYQPSIIPLLSVGAITLTATGGGSNVRIRNTSSSVAKTAIRVAGTFTITGGGGTETVSVNASSCTTSAGCTAPLVFKSDPGLTGVTATALESQYMGTSAAGLTDFGTLSGGVPTKVDYYLNCTGANVPYNALGSAFPGGGCTCTPAAGVPACPATIGSAILDGRVIYWNVSNGATRTISFSGFAQNTATTPSIFIFNRAGAGALNVTLANGYSMFGGVYTDGTLREQGATAGNALNGVGFTSGNYAQLNNRPNVNGVVIVGGTTSITASNATGTTLGYALGDKTNVGNGSLLGFAVVPGSMQTF